MLFVHTSIVMIFRLESNNIDKNIDKKTSFRGCAPDSFAYNSSYGARAIKPRSRKQGEKHEQI
jgi:hypothetical protein